MAYGLESCQCIPGPNDPKTKSCELCCKIPGEDNNCKSSFEWNAEPYNVPDMFSKPGTPCNDYNGYCDVFQKCREVDPSGPLATLRRLLLSEESIASFKKWVISNWYAVSLIIVAVFALLVRFVFVVFVLYYLYFVCMNNFLFNFKLKFKLKLYIIKTFQIKITQDTTFIKKLERNSNRY